MKPTKCQNSTITSLHGLDMLNVDQNDRQDAIIYSDCGCLDLAALYVGTVIISSDNPAFDLNFGCHIQKI